MWRDLRHAAAGLWRSPLFTLTAVAALGLAIGANATIFSLVDGLWFRPPGVRDPGRLVWIYSTDADDQMGPWSYPEYEALRDGTHSFSAVLARGRRGTTMAGSDGTSELLLVNVVTTNFFQALGIEPAAGRLFVPGDEASLEREPAIVLGHSFWRRRFGGDPTVVGRVVQLSRGSGVSVVIAGVLPATFRELDADEDRDIWMPPQTWMRLENRETFARRTDRWFEIVAVRAGTRSARDAQPELDALARQLALAYPETNTGRGVRVISHFQRQVENGGTNALALLGLVLLVVVITCVNVANLLFARGVARARELAVRAALGATRRRLSRELLAECLILGAAGALAGLTLALWLIRIIPSLLTAPPGFRSFTVFQADARVLLFTLVITLVTTILFGVSPSWLSARADVSALIKSGSPAAGGPRVDGRIGRLLAIGQVAVSLVLLAAAAALTQSFVEIRRADIGVGSPNVLTAWTSGGDVAASRMPETRIALDRLAALPGVTRTAVAFRAPLSLSGGGLATPVQFPERVLAAGEAPPSVKFNAVSREYFAVLGLRLVEGRLFDVADDEAAGEPVVIVNQAFAARYFAGRDALNGRVQVGSAAGPAHRIIGIVRNAAINSVTEPPEPYLYLPYWRAAYGEATFLLQASSDAALLAPVVRATLRQIHPALEPRRLVTMREYIDFSGSTYRATAALATVLGAVGFVLTLLGIYGVVAYRTARRAREIGIRMAIGARRLDVLRLVVGEGAVVAAVGIGVGIPAAVAGTRQIAAMLFRVNPADAWILGTVGAILFVSVCAAALLPAWRATRIEPFDALRTS